MSLYDALQLALQPNVIFAVIIAEFFGVFIGAMPGLTATMATALLVPFTYFMDPLAGISMIIAMATVAIFSGDIPAVLLKIPGTPASAAQTIDAYQLGRRKPASTLGVDLVCSALGGLTGSLILMFSAPALAEFTSNFSTVEYFWLTLWGLSMAIVISAEEPIKGVLGVVIGFLIASIGIEPVYGYVRFTFGSVELLNGISFIPAMIGFFAIPELLRQISRPHERYSIQLLKGEKVFDLVVVALKKFKTVIVRSALIGTFIGALPGAGADIAAWTSYGVAKRVSKKPEEYGKGSLEGVVAATTANNAAISGAWIPTLVFGIPGDSITAIALGALMAHGLRPGPMLFERYGSLITAFFIIFIIANLLMILIGYLAIKLSTNILRVPRNILVPVIAVFCVIGAYAVNNSIFDVWVMLVLGILGYFMGRLGIPIPSVVLAIILGPMVEFNFITSLIKSDLNPIVFVSRPIAIGLAILTIFTWVLPFIRVRRIRRST
ncbi:MAG: tripartite tricarboxylate transporter permease [Desulfurococcaceae archaeon]|nr:tripartite tricarboxylate transporter permease [Desulfurococcaceae archaeon]